jgi:hypothetical protein
MPGYFANRNRVDPMEARREGERGERSSDRSEFHYHNSMAHRVVTVTEFKAKCFALLGDIGKRGGTVMITKRGRPLATVGPARRNPGNLLKVRGPAGSRYPMTC